MAVTDLLLAKAMAWLLWICFGPEGVGVWLADDLARSDSKSGIRGVPDAPRRSILRLLRSRSPTSQAPTPCGQNQKAPRHSTPIRFCPADSHALRREPKAPGSSSPYGLHSRPPATYSESQFSLSRTRLARRPCVRASLLAFLDGATNPPHHSCATPPHARRRFESSKRTALPCQGRTHLPLKT